MARWKLCLEYDGAPFVGWQRQGNGVSVQQILEDAVLRLSGESVRVYGSGRTDAGVHALGQMAHVDLQRSYRSDVIRDALNYHMRPWPVAVLSAELVGDDFHARLSATERRYLYRIVNRRAPLTIEVGRAWQIIRPLNERAMLEAAQVLIGRHNFSTFRASECQAKSPIKTLDRFDVMRVGDEIRIEVAARSFLHHQVRNMVGTLEWVGAGKWTAQNVKLALEACDRARGGPTAPAEGLYFVGVSYSGRP
ncbi:tRNA pseudouridine synthase A [Azospirillaceae bacterium]